MNLDCIDCGWDTKEEYYMVHNTLWEQIGLNEFDGMLCVTCFEQRLGRCLCPDDFSDCLLNDQLRRGIYKSSSLLKQRMRVNGKSKFVSVRASND